MSGKNPLRTTAALACASGVMRVCSLIVSKTFEASLYSGSWDISPSPFLSALSPGDMGRVGVFVGMSTKTLSLHRKHILVKE